MAKTSNGLGRRLWPAFANVLRAGLYKRAHDGLEELFRMRRLVFDRSQSGQMLSLFPQLSLFFLELLAALVCIDPDAFNLNKQVIGFFENGGELDIVNVLIRHLCLNLIRVFAQLVKT